MSAPDIRKSKEVFDAICAMPVADNISRNVDRLDDYISPTRIRAFVESNLGYFDDPVSD